MAKQTENKSIRRPSIGGTVAKVAFGLLFIIVSFGEPESSDPATFLAVGLVLGLSLIAWALLPWMRVWKDDKRRRMEAERQREEAARLRAAQKAERENAIKICPACGATGRGRVCEYCGSKLP